MKYFIESNEWIVKANNKGEIVIEDKVTLTPDNISFLTNYSTDLGITKNNVRNIVNGKPIGIDIRDIYSERGQLR